MLLNIKQGHVETAVSGKKKNPSFYKLTISPPRFLFKKKTEHFWDKRFSYDSAEKN